MKDDLWRKTTCGRRQPSVEDDLRWILACCLVRFAAFFRVWQTLPKKVTLKSEQMFGKKNQGQFGYLLIKLNLETSIDNLNFRGQARSNEVLYALSFSN